MTKIKYAFGEQHKMLSQSKFYQFYV